MFINYITLMLVNLTAGLALLAGYLVYGLDHPHQKQWVPAFGVVGALALVTGLHMTFNWTVPGAYNIAFGETSVLFGALFVGTALALAFRCGLLILGAYGFFAGGAALLIGIRIINLGLTRLPPLSGLAFILVGLGGLCAAPTLYFKANRKLRIVGAIVLSIAALLFGLLTVTTYWGHLESFADWQPLPMRTP